MERSRSAGNKTDFAVITRVQKKKAYYWRIDPVVQTTYAKSVDMFDQFMAPLTITSQ
jgi:hypothetical protein